MATPGLFKSFTFLIQYCLPFQSYLLSVVTTPRTSPGSSPRVQAPHPRISTTLVTPLETPLVTPLVTLLVTPLVTPLFSKIWEHLVEGVLIAREEWEGWREERRGARRWVYRSRWRRNQPWPE